MPGIRKNLDNNPLEYCLQDMESGASADSILRRHAEHARFLRPYLELAESLASTETPSPSPEHLGQRRAEFLRIVQHFPSTSPNQPRRQLKMAAVLGLLGLLLFGALGASASTGQPDLLSDALHRLHLSFLAPEQSSVGLDAEDRDEQRTSDSDEPRGSPGALPGQARPTNGLWNVGAPPIDPSSAGPSKTLDDGNPNPGAGSPIPRGGDPNPPGGGDPNPPGGGDPNPPGGGDPNPPGGGDPNPGGGNPNPGGGNPNPGGGNPGGDNPGGGNPGGGNPGGASPGGGNPNPGGGSPGGGNSNPGGASPGGGNPASGNPNPGGGPNPPGGGNPNPGGGNPGGGNPGGGGNPNPAGGNGSIGKGPR